MGEESQKIRTCLDPFGGSGTTALTSQFLGVSSTTIEINPFLVDVIRAKVSAYDADRLAHAFGTIRKRASRAVGVDPHAFFAHTPPTFVEPGLSGRWLFDHAVAKQLAALLTAIGELRDEAHERFFRILVGGILAEVSNVIVSGKGRRYRRNWKDRDRTGSTVLRLFSARAQAAITDVHRFAERPAVRVDILHGDARKMGPRRMHDLAVFSPPYPNSFDYTDVYNLELWMLGYLNDATDNRELRSETLSSHVQLKRDYSEPPDGSRSLGRTMKRLTEIRESLWSPWIPAMVGGYFADLLQVLDRVHMRLRESGRCCIVVGDSRYGGVLVPTAKILGELSTQSGWTIHSTKPVRAMRSSAQQGGSKNLNETLLVLVK
jgi:hypothetical protein